MSMLSSIAVVKSSERAKQLRQAGKKLVVTNGCFDLLHVGHVRYLQAARAKGDVLIVGLNADASVRALKGAGRPLNNENDRAEVLAALEFVDVVTIFAELRATRFIETVRPNVYVKGGDYNSDTLDAEERAALEKIGAKIDIVPFEKGYSTSGLLEQLRSLPK
jgi:rfaE bifunctional protein nucleotidyltransferase chain/domain